MAILVPHARLRVQEGGQQQGGSGVLVPVTCEGPDLTLLTWVRAALCSDAELIRAGELGGVRA